MASAQAFGRSDKDCSIFPNVTMSETFIELVPRSEASLQASMKELEASGIAFDGYNIPEFVRANGTYLSPEQIMKLRFIESINPNKQLAIHMRTRDASVTDTISRLESAAAHAVNTILLVTGDPAKKSNGCTHAHDVLDAMAESPLGLAVAADLYQKNWGRWENKIPALRRGIATSVFTQPIFHPSMLDVVRSTINDLVRPEKVYAGITWMTSHASRRYWHEKNNVPLAHLAGGVLDSHITHNSMKQAADVLRATRQQGLSTYIMLMRGTVRQLEIIMNMSENLQEY